MSRDYQDSAVKWQSQLTQTQQDLDWVKIQMSRGYLETPVGRQTVQADLKKIRELLQQIEEALSK